MSRSKKTDEPSVLLRLGKHFINQENIRGLKRKGKHTVVSLIKGEDITVEIDYDKIKSLLPGLRN